MSRTPDRRRRAVAAASLVGGSADVLDFLLPLWAGAALGASPARIGALSAVELFCSFLARPLAGHLADTRERARVAALGALLQAVGCAGFALVRDVDLLLLPAVASGVGGALLWVAVRAVVAEGLAEDGGAFAGLLSSVALVSWFFWVPALVLLPVLGFRGVFAGLAAACVVAAVMVVRAPRGAAPDDRPLPGDEDGRGVRRVVPLLGAVALTEVAEAGVGLLLLLHLQRDVGLDVVQVALVLLPGGIALTVLPRPLHRLTARHGRRAVYVGASLGSAAFAAVLATSPGPVVVAALWVLTAVAWAALGPVQEAAVAERLPGRAGRGMSLLGNAALAGGAAGSALAGVLYGAAPWAWVCAVFAGVIAAGAVAGPWALDRMGVADQPPDAVGGPDPRAPGQE